MNKMTKEIYEIIVMDSKEIQATPFWSYMVMYFKISNLNYVN